jgi:hypothetical protein
MHGQCFSFQIHGAQAQNRRVLNGHMGDQIRIWTIAACWLIGTVAVFCSAGKAQTSTVRPVDAGSDLAVHGRACAPTSQWKGALLAELRPRE